MNNNIEWEHKNDKKIKNKEFKRMKKLLLSKEEEELLYLMGKNNFANQISMTDLNLLPNNDNNKKRNNKNNVNLVNQIGLVYNKIYEKDKYRKINNKKLLDEELEKSISTIAVDRENEKDKNKRINNIIFTTLLSITQNMSDLFLDCQIQANIIFYYGEKYNLSETIIKEISSVIESSEKVYIPFDENELKE